MSMQDSVEFYQHLLELMARAERTGAHRMGVSGSASTADLFKWGCMHNLTGF